MNPSSAPVQPIETGVPGLDALLKGGFPGRETYLVQGEPGTGVTTLGLQFLLQGAARGEPALYISLSQTRSALERIAASHGWSLDGVEVFELTDADDLKEIGTPEQTFFDTTDSELRATFEAILAAVREHQPTRVVIDTISQIRLLAGTPLRYRRQMLALKLFFSECACTTLLLTNDASGADPDISNIVHGVIELEQHAPSFGNASRRLRVVKMRGLLHHAGYHTLDIRRGGVVVYPQLAASVREPAGRDAAASERVASGVEGLDALWGGGLEMGTACLFAGHSGAGKSSVSSAFAHAAVGQGRRVLFFLFEERTGTFFRRNRGLGYDFAPAAESGQVVLREIDASELAPHQFPQWVREAVEQTGAEVVVIDSLAGYVQAVPQDALRTTQLHELVTFLTRGGVLVLLTFPFGGLVADDALASEQMSEMAETAAYIADSVALLRLYESEGSLRSSIGILKDRLGQHERTFRQLAFGADGLAVSEPLATLRGLLDEVPFWSSDEAGAGAPPEAASGDGTAR